MQKEKVKHSIMPCSPIFDEKFPQNLALSLVCARQWQYLYSKTCISLKLTMLHFKVCFPAQHQSMRMKELDG